jgi:hypothetical protein
MKLDDKQVAYILLRHCIALPKFRFALRTCPTELIMQAIARFDCILRETTSELLGVQLTEDQFDQAALPIRYGGLGLSRAIDVAAISFISSVKGSAEMQAKILAVDFPDNALYSPRSTFHELQSLQQMSPVLDDNTVTQAFSHPRTASATLSQKNYEWQKDRLIHNLQNSVDEKDKISAARLRSCAGNNAGAWLNVLPVMSLKMQPQWFITAVKFRLGATQFAYNEVCNQCNRSPNDILGNHAVSCPNSGDRISRHNNIAKELYRTCQSALFNPRLEERNLMHGNERPGDLFIENWAHGRPAAFDVSVIHPAAYSYFRNASKQDNAAATERETTKIRKYAELNAINPAPINYQFCPLVVESFGSWSDAACKIIVRIAKSQATVIGLAGHIAVERLFQRLSVTLQKFNASMILNRSPITA